MGYKDGLKKSQGSSSFIKLPISMEYDTKNEGGYPQFVYWDDEEKKRVFTREPIEGVLLGRAFRLSAFDVNLGKNGGSWESSFYFSNEYITLLDNNRKKVMSGTKDEVKAFIAKQPDADKVTTKYCFFILTLDGEIVVVVTNMILSIDRLAGFDKDVFIDYCIKLVPSLYSPDNKSIKKFAHEKLGPFAKKNPPAYCEVLQGKPITEELAEEIEIERYANLFNAWKEQKMKPKTTEEEKITEEVDTQPTKPTKQSEVKAEPGSGVEKDPPDDLPF